MFNTFKRISENLNLEYSNKNKLSFGDYNGINVMLKNFTSSSIAKYIIVVPFNSRFNDNIFSIVDELVKKLELTFKHIDYCNYNKNSLVLIVNYRNRLRLNKKELIQQLDMITNFCLDNNFQSCCNSCGEAKLGTVYEVNDMPNYFCDSCFEFIKNDINESNETNRIENKTSYLKAALGGFLFSIIGATIWIFIALGGYLSTFSILSLILSIIAGFKVFGGKFTKKGILIVTLINFIMVIVCNYLTVSIYIYQEFSYEGLSIIDSIIYTPDFIFFSNETKSFFVDDLLWGLISVPAIAIGSYRVGIENREYYDNKDSIKNIE